MSRAVAEGGDCVRCSAFTRPTPLDVLRTAAADAPLRETVRCARARPCGTAARAPAERQRAGRRTVTCANPRPRSRSKSLSHLSTATSPSTECRTDAIPIRKMSYHETLKGLDVGLGYAYAGLEKAADHAAASWAERGLSRHDLEAQGQLEVETALESQARQIFWRWLRDVRLRVDGAIARELRNLAAAVGGANAAPESYRAAEEQLKLLNPRGVPKAGNTSPRAPQDPQTPALDLPQVGEQQTQESPVQAEVQDTTLATRQLHGWFWPLMAALVVAEFIGNAPVFTELFPGTRNSPCNCRNG